MKSGRLQFLFAIILVLTVLPASSQTDPNLENGFKPYGTYSGSNIDSINLENGNLIVHIPMPFGLPQRGRIQPSYFLGITSKQWSQDCTGTSCEWLPNFMFQDLNPAPAARGTGVGFDNSFDLSVMRNTHSVVDTVDSGQNQFYEYMTSLNTADGTSHKLASGITTDVTGYVAVESNPDANGIPQTVTIRDRAGNVYTTGGWQTISSTVDSEEVPDPNHPGQNGWITTTDTVDVAHVTGVTDPNGNQIVFTGQDTMGRTITMQGFSGTQSITDYSKCVSPAWQPIASATISNYTGFNGATNQVEVCYTNVSLATNFGLTGVAEWPNGQQEPPVPMIVSVIFLADNSTWSFQYDSYGNLTYVGLPLGGSIQYQWQTHGFPNCPYGQPNAPAEVSRAVSQRVITDGNNNSYTWKYSYGTAACNNTLTNTMTDPLGDDTVNVFSQLQGVSNNYVNDNPAPLYVTATKVYQGSQTSGQLLKREDLQYYSNGQSGGNNVVNGFVTQVQTTINGKVTQTTRTPDASGYGTGAPLMGVVTVEKKYDFGAGQPGALINETDTSYFWQSNSNYLAANMIELPASVQIKDGNGNVCAETDTGYDDSNRLTSYSGTAPNHGSPPNAVRGNLTSVSRKLTTTACSITSSTPSVTSYTNWYDTGEVYKTIDPLGNATTHSYDPYYDGAYPTKTCNALSQCVSGTYDFNSGVLTSFTNANATTQASANTPGDSAHTSLYSYDVLGRMTEATFPPDPDNQNVQATTQFIYPMPVALPFAVTRKSSVTNALTDAITTTYDGLGRPYKTVHNSANNATVLTTYDGLSRVATVTNPFFSTSDPTYGVTQTQYDALGRVTQVTKQDGSMTAAQYSQTSGNDICTLGTDESGKQRRTCTDGLGRLVEVDEPQASSSAGTAATASVTISGSLQSNSGGSALTTASGTPIVMANMDDIYVLGSNEHVYEYYDWRGWWSAFDVTGATGSAVAASGSQIRAYYDSSGRTYVFYVGSNQHLEDVYFNGSWNTQDLTNTLPWGVVPSPTTPIAMGGGGDFYYMDSGGSIYEITLLSNGTWAGWSNFNLMYATGATHAATSSPITAYRDGSSSTHVLYIGSNQHLEHTYYNVSAGSWQAQDLTTMFSGGVTPASNTPIVMGGGGDFYYADSAGNMREISLLSNESWAGWSNFSPTYYTGAPAVASGSQMAAYQDSSGRTYVVYVGTNQHLEVVYYNGGWYAEDLTSTYSGTPPATTTPIVMANGGDFFYFDSNGHVHEATVSNGSWAAWTTLDITGGVGAPGATSNSRLFASFNPSTWTTSIYDEGSDQELHRQWCCEFGNWTTLNLSADAAGATDSGTVSLTVGGLTATVCFGDSSSSACSGQTKSYTSMDVAAALANVINSSASSQATATVSGSTINLTWKVPGPFSPAISALSTTHDNPGSFPNPSFTSPATNFANGTGNLGSSQYVTLYSYDALGNLTQVNQKGDNSQPARVRTFTYDSLSRVLTSSNPETGLISYTYDADGNLLQKTSPAPNQTGTSTQTISYCYDALNRVTGKKYAAASCPLSSPVVTYTYDTGPNAVGHFTSLTDQAGSASYSYNVLGRVSSEQRTINPGSNLPSITKTVGYHYNLNSSVVSVTYPSGSVITYTPDAAGRMLSAVDLGNNINYVTGATYGADSSLTGFVSGYVSGGFSGVTSNLQYNPRLQLCRVTALTAGSMPTSCIDQVHLGNVLDLGYNFNFGVGDNGNVSVVTNYKDTGRTQTFTYDALNRLASAQNAGTDCTKKTLNSNQTEYWGNSYSYDPWSNLTGKTVTKCSAETLSLGTATINQLHTISGPDYQYDAAGNMTYDVSRSLNYSFDPENRISSAGGYTYAYDADGSRVEKTTGGTSPTGTLYWYSTLGILAESDLSGNIQHEYIFFAGERAARKDLPGNTVSYYFADHLKTTSIVTDSAGTIKADSDYYPWGGELQFVNNDSNDYKFTGKKRDTESGLDYFGARYYANWYGRLVTPDWSPDPVTVPFAHLDNPQTLNLYAYVDNNPINGIDMDGHSPQQSIVAEPGGWGETMMSNGCGETGGCLPFLLETTATYDIDRTTNTATIAGVQTTVVTAQQAAALSSTGTAAASATTGSGWMAVATTVTTAAAGALVVGSAYLLITRITDASVENSNDLAHAAAVESVISAENILLSKNKDTLKVIRGLAAAAAVEIGKINPGSPQQDDNHHKKEIRAMLDRAKRLAERLPKGARDAVLKGIQSLEGKVPGGLD